jgi:hypothetical protein
MIVDDDAPNVKLGVSSLPAVRPVSFEPVFGNNIKRERKCGQRRIFPLTLPSGPRHVRKPHGDEHSAVMPREPDPLHALLFRGEASRLLRETMNAADVILLAAMLATFGIGYLAFIWQRWTHRRFLDGVCETCGAPLSGDELYRIEGKVVCGPCAGRVRRRLGFTDRGQP